MTAKASEEKILNILEISVGHSRNWTDGHCVTSLHTDVRRQLKDRGILQNAYYREVYRLLLEGGIRSKYLIF